MGVVVIDCSGKKPVVAEREFTEEELAQAERDREAGEALVASQLRAQRDALLAASDWTQLPDVLGSMPEAAAEEWRAYRQLLRDNPLGPWPPTP